MLTLCKDFQSNLIKAVSAPLPMTVTDTHLTALSPCAPRAFVDAFEQFPEPVILTDLARRVIWCNAHFENLLGHELTAVQGTSTRSLYANMHDFDHIGGKRAIPKRDLDRRCYTAEYRHKDGAKIFAETTSWPVKDAEGQLIGFAAILRDKTATYRVNEALSDLYRISSSQSLTGSEKIDAILALGRRFFGLPIALVSLIRDDKFTVLFSNCAHADIPPTTQFCLDETFCHQTLETGAPHAVHQIDENSDAQTRAVGDKTGLQAYIGLPLTVDGERFGTLGFSGPAARPAFGKADFDVLKLCGAWIAQELSLEMSYQALTREAQQDWLTGAGTNRAFRKTLNMAFAKTRLSPSSAQLILFDIDHFKSINDRFGHDRGDVVLRSIAQAVQEKLGRDLKLYRIGGEEFAVILEQCDTQFAVELAESLREAIASLALGFDTSASFGVSPAAKGFKTENDWLKCADLALYAAKHNGRNQVVTNNGVPSLRVSGKCPMTSCPESEECNAQRSSA